jgi:hypothetical protein
MVERMNGLLATDEERVGANGNGTRSRIGIAGFIRADSACGAVATSGARRPAWISAESVFQSAAPNIFETSSRLSLWLIVTALEARE